MTINRFACLFALAFLPAPCFAEVPAEQIHAARVVVEALDARGMVLQSSLGFVLDEVTVATSYQAVKGAAALRLKSGDYQGSANRILSCNNFMDLALVKSAEEIPMDATLAGSDTLAAGDLVYYLSSEKKDWQILSSKVSSWQDSGQGYEMMKLDPAPEGFSSPLFNSAGKVVGWISGGMIAPMKAIYQFFAEKDSALPLAELSLEGRFWSLFRSESTAQLKDTIEAGEMKTVQGPPSFPFRLSLPEAWPFQTGVQPDRYLLIAMNGRFGVTFALRVTSAQTEDLMAEMERVEALMLQGIPRAELAPYSADHYTGMKAVYEEPDATTGYSTDLFCTLSNQLLYTLTVTYPRKHHEEIRPLIEEIVASFRL